MNRKSLLAAAAGLMLATPLFAQSAGKPVVAILPFNNSAIGKANEELAPLSKGIADLMIEELAGNPNMRVVERDQLMAVMAEQKLATDGKVDPATAVKVGKLLNAGHMITGSYITDRNGTMVLTIKCFNTETSQIEFTTSVTGKTENMLVLINQGGVKVNKGLKLADLPPAQLEAAAKKAEKTAMPLREVLLFSRALEAKDSGNKTEAVTLFRQVLDKFPDYAPAKKEIASLASK